MQDIIIREATENDLKSLQIFLPSDIPGFHEEVLTEFKEKRAIWLLAFYENQQIGHVRIRWDGSRTEKIKQNINNTPNIEALGVKEMFRSKGVGSHLLSEVERTVKDKGYSQAGLAMEIDNNNIKQFYSKRGYGDWDKGTFISEWEETDKTGNVRKATQEYTYLIKSMK